MGGPAECNLYCDCCQENSALCDRISGQDLMSGSCCAPVEKAIARWKQRVALLGKQKWKQRAAVPPRCSDTTQTGRTARKHACTHARMQEMLSVRREESYSTHEAIIAKVCDHAAIINKATQTMRQSSSSRPCPSPPLLPVALSTPRALKRANEEPYADHVDVPSD